jgi:GT2 family glycosyltransferase
VRFIDNSSTDSTLNDLQAIAPLLSAAGYTVKIIQQANKGYGAGHNTGIAQGTAPFCLITNIDIVFEPDALRRIMAVALADHEHTAAWELRQKPYEHPKFYDPVTGITNWNSHACVLLRRNALDQVGSYDDTLFMYGEDVELSYRLRRAGYLLRYCPQAVVWHYSYESADQIKPIQYVGSTFANLYLRLKYGNHIDACSVPMLGLRLLSSPEVYPGSRSAVLRSLLKLATVTPKALLSRQRSTIHFPFRTWDYELNRDGAFVEQQALPVNPPLVSVITRTYRGRELFLRQALLSVAHQTYPNIEHIVVEDGGATMRPVVDNINQTTGRSIQFIQLDKLGRSATGNAGLSVAKGRWCLFLDDDDLLFAEHVEVLVNTLLANTDTVAAYSLTWEVLTDSNRLAKGEYSELDHGVPSVLRQDFDYAVLRHHNFMPIQSVLFERTLFEQRGGFEEDMDALEDWVLWKKYARGNQFVYVPKVTSLYRVPADPVKIAQRITAFDLAYPLALARHSGHVQAIEAPQR